MRVSRPMLLLAFTLGPLGACRTTQSTSATKYANAPTTLKEIRGKTCHYYVKKDDCLLRLLGYESDARVSASITEQIPAMKEALKGYGTDLDDTSKENVAGIFATNSKYHLPDPELYSLVAYTGPQFSAMNGSLRGNQDLWAKYKDIIYGTASALTKLKSLTVRGNVYRTERTSAEKTDALTATYKVGNIVVETPFLSTTNDSELNFSVSEGTPDQILLRYTIVSMHGVDVSHFSAFPQEKEVLFPPGSVFQVNGFDTSTTLIKPKEGSDVEPFMMKTLNITLEEVDPV